MFFILSIFVGLYSFADCHDLEIQQLSNIDFTTDPLPSESIRVKRNGAGGCSFFLTVDNGDASSFATRRLLRNSGGNIIPVQICLDSNCSSILKHLPEVTSNSDTLSGSFPSGTTSPSEIVFTFYPRLSNINYERFGTYEDHFDLNLYEGSLAGSKHLEDSDSFRLRFRMSKKIDLSVVNSGAPFDLSATNKTLNFGTLVAGAQQGFDLVLKFNAGYRLRFSSQNNGALKRGTLGGTIPYVLSLNGIPVNLAGSSGDPVTVAKGSGVSSPGGLRFAGLATVGSIGGAQPGTYWDSITVSVVTYE